MRAGFLTRGGEACAADRERATRAEAASQSAGAMELEVVKQVQEGQQDSVDLQVEEQLGDLLICLGQEEQKVGVLSDEFVRTGRDPQVEPLLPRVVARHLP
jgi:hypothetical protein